MCRRMAAELAKTGLQVVAAHDVERAISQSTSTPPDIAIVDLDLGSPTKSGLDVIRYLKQTQGEAVHVIMLTGHDDEVSRATAFEAGTDDFLHKPIDFAEIRHRIAAASRAQRAFVALRNQKEAAERRLVYGHEANALLAHDLNNGLAVALSNLTYLLDSVKGDAEQMDALTATLRTVRRMSGLVANFVDISRFEDAAVTPIVEQTLVHQLLASVIDVNAPSTNHVTFRIDCPQELVGRFDAGLVERVLHNLLGNAIRYCGRGGTVMIRARRWHEAEDGSVEILVTNTGPLVADGLRSNLFGKYVQGRGGRRGMGLYFCRLVAEAHGGTISYEPQADGPGFVVRLPGHAYSSPKT